MNEYNKPILSICIPTYNRVNSLKETILSIIKQERFRKTDDVEIIISDNCSDDNTATVVNDYTKIYGNKIRYYKNKYNIFDLNFQQALSYGEGVFLKLNNDTLKHRDGSLDKIIEIINKEKAGDNLLFFLNGEKGLTNTTLCNNIDSFVKKVSFFSTWIGAFGIWKNDFVNLKSFSRRSDLKLIQVDVLFRLINLGRKVLVINDKLFDTIPPGKKGGYDLLTVFLDNYIFLLTEQLGIGALSKKTFKQEKRKLLLKYLAPALVYTKLWPGLNCFEVKNKYSRIFNHYKKDIVTLFLFYIYYYLLIPYLFIKIQK